MRRRSKRGLVWATGLRIRQFRRRWRTRRERHAERTRRRTLEQRVSGRMAWKHHRRLRWTIMGIAALLVLWVLYSAVLMVRNQEPGVLAIATWCEKNPRSYYCGQVQEFVKAPLYVALGLAVFLGGRYFLVNRWYRRNVLRNRQLVVPSSGRNVSDVDIVGRDELCELIIQRLRDNHTRRPLILIGGIGAGKTATLVRLAELLAGTDVVPVGIELRNVGAPGDLDFRQLARKQFQRTIDTQLRAEGEADKVWRRLCLENRLVVLADGLEETLADAAQPVDRDSMIRQAVASAVRERLPLVLTSRPADPLRGLNALLLQLEPLSEGAALEYVRARGRPGEPGFRWHRIAELVTGADVADSPIYLRIIGELYAVDRLDAVELTGRGRASVRWNLLEEWYRAVVAGDLYEYYGIPSTERSDALEVLSALACLGLRDNRMTVRTVDLTGPTDGPDAGRRRIMSELAHRLDKLEAGNAQDIGLAQSAGVELNLVVKQHDGVRFQHGVLQAYLGARYLPAAFRDEDFLRQVFGSDPGPGRELLTALTLYAQSSGRFERGEASHLLGRTWPLVRGNPRRRHPGRPDAGAARATRSRTWCLVDRLCSEALRAGNRTRALEMFAAALEMDAAAGHRAHRRLARAIRRAWPCYQGDGLVTDRPLEDAKVVLVYRFGAAAGLLGAWPGSGWPSSRPVPQYDQLFEMMGDETSYLPRLTAARVLAAGGNATVRRLHDLLDVPADGHGDLRQENLRQMRAWLAPGLFLFASPEPTAAGSAPAGTGRECLDVARDNLRRWVRRLAVDQPDGVRLDEINLAQGFRLAANARLFPTHRSMLLEEAEKALRYSRFWHSHLVLIQALTLLALPRDPGETLQERGHGSDPRGLVGYWISIAGGGERAPQPGGGPVHPLVHEAAELCVEALIERHPQRHCWVDEREIVGRVGSASLQSEIRRVQDLWLPPSLGWGVLQPRAQRLLADVMLLLNLADRGRDHRERARRLNRSNRPDLPPCLTIDRTAMRVNLSRRQAHDVQPGATCIDDCVFRLCPLPPRGDDLPYPMDETFCARQIDLVGRWYRSSGRPPWQVVNRDDLRTFWREMSERMDPAWRK